MDSQSKMAAGATAGGRRSRGEAEPQRLPKKTSSEEEFNVHANQKPSDQLLRSFYFSNVALSVQLYTLSFILIFSLFSGVL